MPPILEELVAAVGRGVEVVLVVPTVANGIDSNGQLLGNHRRTLARSPHFTLAGLAGLGPDGARHPVHVHSKLMLVDDAWATVGSANLHRYSLDGNSELNIALSDALAVRALRSELLAEHLGKDTSALDGQSALRLFRTVAERNAGRRERGDPDWEGIACAMDPLQWWAS